MWIELQFSKRFKSERGYMIWLGEKRSLSRRPCIKAN